MVFLAYWRINYQDGEKNALLTTIVVHNDVAVSAVEACY